MLFLMLPLPGALSAQAAPVLELAKSNAVFAEPFSLLRGARELPDGRLLVTDWIEQRVAVLDFARGQVSDRGRVGGGPGEFRLPGALFALPGDSTLLVDVGNGRLNVLDPDGRIVRTFKPPVEAAAAPGGTDDAGRLYFTIPGWLASPPLPRDSVELVVWDPATSSTRVLARIHGSTRPASNYAPEPRVPFVVFARQDAWSVSPDGQVVIVGGDDYTVSWLRAGRILRGPANSIRPIPASAAERTAYVRQFLQSSPTSGRGEGGGLGHTPAEMLSDQEVARVVRASAFAETLPFFRSGDTRVDSRNRVWVGRWLSTSDARRYDVFDAQGQLTASVRLPNGRTLLTLGRQSLYLVNVDEDGLQWIERYASPLER
jgi:hypothetical protein